MAVQGSSLSDMTSTLQSMDPLHTAYLDWHLFMRNFLAVCVPALPTLSAGQLLDLKQRMQKADSNADGLLIQTEWQSVDMQPLSMAATGCAQAAACSSSSADAVAGRPAREGQQTDVNASSDAPCKSDEVASGKGVLSEVSAAHLNDLLWLMFADSNAALNFEEVMLYLCCDVDGAEGLQKAFAVLTGSESEGQVCLVIIICPSKPCGSVVEAGNSVEASLTCRLMRSRLTGCLQGLTLHMLK